MDVGIVHDSVRCGVTFVCNQSMVFEDDRSDVGAWAVCEATLSSERLLVSSEGVGWLRRPLCLLEARCLTSESEGPVLK